MSYISDTIHGLEEVSQISGLSTSRLRQLITRGQLPATKVSGGWIVKGSDLLPFTDRARRSGRPRLYELIIDQDVAHIGSRGGSLISLCGNAQVGAAWVHPMLASSDVQGVPLCHKCCADAPRYVVRYWRQRGAL